VKHVTLQASEERADTPKPALEWPVVEEGLSLLVQSEEQRMRPLVIAVGFALALGVAVTMSQYAFDKLDPPQLACATTACVNDDGQSTATYAESSEPPVACTSSNCVDDHGQSTGKPPYSEPAEIVSAVPIRAATR